MTTVARSDHRTAEAVSMALQILHRNGPQDALWWMHQAGVPADVIFRVIYNPEQRRQP